MYGPIKRGDPNGLECIFAIICVSTGVVFVQSLRAKSEAVASLWAFARWFALRTPKMEAALGVAQGSLELNELRFDRGGEFTFTWGSTKTVFDEAAKEIFLGRWLGSPDAPKTASPHIERSWGTMGAMRLMRLSARRLRLPTKNCTP